jgi:thymidylate synthase
MNMFGFIHFNKNVIAAGVSKKTGKKVELGRLNWQADSYHIYGKDILNAKQLLFDRIESVHFADRTFNFSDDFIADMYHGAEPAILEKIKTYDSGLG